MQVPLSWLRAYVDINLTPTELANRLTMAGLETTEGHGVGADWGNMFVGHVVSVEPHPNADRLKLATVDLGSEQLTVVCGAPNVAGGQRIAFAKVGARVVDAGTGNLETLKAARIRGTVSEGMVCSERELGLGDNHTGILVLDQDAPVGMSLADYMGDALLDTDPTPNRPDWLSILGVAHEVAALTGGPMREPALSYPEDGSPIENLVTITVEAPDLAPRYTASLITGVRVGPSPQWMQERLLKVGQRPINNLVDITNYVMLEYGQPLHAFDYDTLAEKTVRVRRAAVGETLVTLDGEARPLSPDMLVIADGARSIGLAGVMGGANTEMTDATTSVLLEAASFDAANIRRTRTALRLRTEASTRFERGLNPELATVALRRATQLIVELAGGQAAQGIIDLFPGRVEPDPVILTVGRVEKVLGVSYSLEEIEQVLASLGFTTERSDDASILVSVPYWRSDITIEDDLVEEVARIKGYDSIPTTFLSRSIPPHEPQPMRDLRERVRDLLAAAGMQETLSYPLTSREALDGAHSLGDAGEPIKLSNPMNQKPEDFRPANIRDTLPYREYLRSNLRAGILDTLASNQRFGQTGLNIFEVGRVYLPRNGDLPDEQEVAVGVMWGDQYPLSWAKEGGKADVFDAKGIVEAVLASLGVTPEFTPAQDTLLHPGRAAAVSVAAQQVGVLGEVRSDILDSFGVSGEGVALFALNLASLLPLLPTEVQRFVPLARFQGSYRDMALLVDVDVQTSRLESIIKRHGLVESVTLFDVYAGQGVPEGKRSLAFRLHLQSPRGTLTAETINAVHAQVLRDLERETGARLRE